MEYNDLELFFINEETGLMESLGIVRYLNYGNVFNTYFQINGGRIYLNDERFIYSIG